MFSIRPSTFETNSSSCHAIVHLSKDEIKNFSQNRYDMVIHIPDCEGYREEDIGRDYELLSIADAMALYNSMVDLTEENYQRFIKEYPEHHSKYSHTPYEKFTDEDKFYDSIAGYLLEENDVFGKFMTYEQLLTRIIINTDMKFDVQWWNNT